MRFRTKVAIFLVAVFLTLLGFNLVASPAAVDLLKIGKEAGYDRITHHLSKADVHHSIAVKG